MAHAFASTDISASADQVWQLIGGFGSLPDWLPYISKSELSEGDGGRGARVEWSGRFKTSVFFVDGISRSARS